MIKPVAASILAATLSVTTCAWAAETAPPTTSPSTQPAPSTRPVASIDEQVGKLIQQLSNEDFKIRDQATEDLKKLGKPALPAMKTAAARSDDPEVKARVEAVVAAIEKPVKAKPPVLPGGINHGGIQIHVIQGGGGMVIGGGKNVAIRKTVQNGVTTTDAEEDGKKIHIQEDADGIAMSVTETKDGKQVTQEFKAKDLEELKKNHADAAELYEKYNQGNGGAIMIQQIKVRANGGPGGVVVEPDQDQAK